MSFRTYHDLQHDDQSHVGAQVRAQRDRLAERLSDVSEIVAVMSGKGGVGKSYVTAVLANGAAAGGASVGVLDADLTSPTVSRMLGATGRIRTGGEAVQPVATAEGVRVVSTDFLLREDAPLTWRAPVNEGWVWRGALEAGILREFLADVDWGPLDLLLVDLPPGPAGLADLATLVPRLRGAVAVTIPSEEARRSVARTMHAAQTAGFELLGVVENMAGYACDGCGSVRPLFAGDAGDRLAHQFEVPLLGRLPFRPDADADPSLAARALAKRLREALA